MTAWQGNNIRVLYDSNYFSSNWPWKMEERNDNRMERKGGKICREKMAEGKECMKEK